MMRMIVTLVLFAVSWSGQLDGMLMAVLWVCSIFLLLDWVYDGYQEEIRRHRAGRR